MVPHVHHRDSTPVSLHGSALRKPRPSCDCPKPLFVAIIRLDSAIARVADEGGRINTQSVGARFVKEAPMTAAARTLGCAIAVALVSQCLAAPPTLSPWF